MGAPAAIRPGGPSAHRCRLPAPSIFRRSVRPLTTGLESGRLGAAAWGAAAPRARFARNRPGSAGREHRSRQRPERDRSAATAGASPARCVQLREAVEASRRHPRQRQPAEPWGVGARARQARARAGRLRAAGGVGRGRCARSLAVGRREAACVGVRALPSLAVCAPPRPQERGLSKAGSMGPFHSLWGCNRCAGCSLDLAPLRP